MATLRGWFDELADEIGKPSWICFGAESYDLDKFEDWDVELGVLIPFGQVPASVLDREFDDSYGGTESPSLVAWTADHVVFSVCYDGAEWLSYVPRDPTEKANPRHHGGG
jgi:hypothetical protein